MENQKLTDTEVADIILANREREEREEEAERERVFSEYENGEANEARESAGIMHLIRTAKTLSEKEDILIEYGLAKPTGNRYNSPTSQMMSPVLRNKMMHEINAKDMKPAKNKGSALMQQGVIEAEARTESALKEAIKRGNNLRNNNFR